MAHSTAPSKESSADNRAKGELICSGLVVRGLVIVAVAVAAGVLWRGDEVIHGVKLFYAGVWPERLDTALGGAVLVLSGVALGAAILGALLLTRGKLQPSGVAPRIRRGGELEAGRSLRLFSGILGTLCALLVGGLVAYLFIGEFFLLFRREPAELPSDLWAIGGGVCRVLIVVGGGLAILGGIGARIAVMTRNRPR